MIYPCPTKSVKNKALQVHAKASPVGGGDMRGEVCAQGKILGSLLEHSFTNIGGAAGRAMPYGMTGNWRRATGRASIPQAAS